jgi:hypothetical protein
MDAAAATIVNQLKGALNIVDTSSTVVHFWPSIETKIIPSFNAVVLKGLFGSMDMICTWEDAKFRSAMLWRYR